MKKYLILSLVVLSLGCGEQPQNALPEGVLSIDKMTAIMVDVQLIEAGIVVRKYNRTQRKDQITDYYRALFNKHEVSKQTFDLSLQFYTDHPDQLEEIYEGLMERLSELQAEIANEKVDTSAVE